MIEAGSCDEAATYHTNCGPEHDAFAEHLHRARGRRGLFIEFTGKSRWGLGHALWNIYVLHDVCRQLERFCYIKLYDMELGQLMGYAAQNLSWGEPSEAERQLYHGIAGTLKLKYGKWAGHKASSMNLIDALRRPAFADVPFVHVVTPGPLQTIHPDHLHVLRFDVDLRNTRASSCGSASPDAPLNYCEKLLPRLSRCFCRFVTEPRYAIEASSWGTTYQLRTGFADVSDRVLEQIDLTQADLAPASSCPPTPERGGAVTDAARGWRYEEMRRWLLLACLSPASLRRLADGHLLTDSPMLRAYLGGRRKCARGNDAARRLDDGTTTVRHQKRR